MKRPTFLLVHKKAPPVPAAEVKRALERIELPRDKPGAALRNYSPRFIETLFASTTGLPSLGIAGGGAGPEEKLSEIVGDLTRRAKVDTVGIWDLDAYVTGLHGVIDALNAAQPAITFFEVQAAIPAGMISRREAIIAWAEKQLGGKLTPRDRKDIGQKTIADDFFFERAETVRSDLGLDYLIGISPSIIAGKEGRTLVWDLFSSARGRLVLISTAGLREFAREANRPFEMAVADLIVSGALVAMNDDLGFHDDTGCLFDYHEDRRTIIGELRHPKVEAKCLKLMKPRFRPAAQALVQALAEYR
ncbi:MAG: hypothetical protein HYZ57_14740 [Acidobacteria bacterium]|nr:hypothetical protein [Acidobacteriota bacterium]MBI3281089.1 hypothetical protein [Acidobacteriota bacterium]